MSNTRAEYQQRRRAKMGRQYERTRARAMSKLLTWAKDTHPTIWHGFMEDAAREVVAERDTYRDTT